jgi:hypothetical protein
MVDDRGGEIMVDFNEGHFAEDEHMTEEKNTAATEAL